MQRHLFTDVAIACAVCGDTFVFTAGERELQALRGLPESPPDSCFRCRRGDFGSGAATRPLTRGARTGSPRRRSRTASPSSSPAKLPEDSQQPASISRAAL